MKKGSLENQRTFGRIVHNGHLDQLLEKMISLFLILPERRRPF